jgi:hypothetical protein
MIHLPSHIIPSVDCISVTKPMHICGVLHNDTPKLLTLDSTHFTHTVSSTATTQDALSYRLHSLLKVQKSYLCVSVRQLEGNTPPGMTRKGTVWEGID